MHFLSPLTSTQWGLALYFSSGIDLLKRWISISGQLLDPLLCRGAPPPPLSPAISFFLQSSLSWLPFSISLLPISFLISLSPPSFLLFVFLAVWFHPSPSLSLSFLHSYLYSSFPISSPCLWGLPSLRFRICLGGGGGAVSSSGGWFSQAYSSK